jgi:hypothetical protein
MEMRKNIDQIVAGSRSQYLTQVNGMPPVVLKHLLQSQREFVNGSRSTLIAKDTLMAPREEGGLGLLDIEARNDAILLVKAAALAETDPEKRAEWASLTIHRLSQNIRKAPVVKEEAKTHPLIQNYMLAKRDPPKLHKAMLKCMDKYGVIFETVSPTEDIQRALPLWHHPGEDPTKTQKNNGAKAHCLRTKHGVKTLGEGVDLAERLKKNAHKKTADCSCADCIEDRTERGCKNPHACATAAIDRMKQIRPKWE